MNMYSLVNSRFIMGKTPHEDIPEIYGVYIIYTYIYVTYIYIHILSIEQSQCDNRMYI